MKKGNLLLLHGALGSEAQLETLKLELENQYTVFTLNFEGHGGRSSNRTFSITHFMENVVAFLDENAIASTDIFGYSMGGYVALTLALHQPKRVNRIVTFGTKFHWTPESAQNEVKMLNPEVIEEKVPKFASHLNKVHAPVDWKEVMSKTAQMMLDLGDHPPLHADTLSQIPHEVTIGIGTEDNMVSIEESEKAAASLQNGKLDPLEGFLHPIERNALNDLAMFIVNVLH